jgi:oligosaccharide repeat unit polymerase
MFIVSAAIISTGIPKQSFLSSTILFLMSLYGCSRLSFESTSNTHNFGIVIYWLYLTFFTFIPGFTQVASGEYFWESWGGYREQLVLLAATLLALAALLTDLSYRYFYRSGSVRHKSRALSAPESDIYSPSQSRFFIPLCLLAYAWALWLVATLGFSNFIGTRGSFSNILHESFSLAAGGLLLTTNSALLIVLLIYGLNLLLSPLIKNSYLFKFNFVAIVMFNLLINYPARLPRFILFGTILCLLIVFVVRARTSFVKDHATYILAISFPALVYFVFRFFGVSSRREVGDLSAAIQAIVDVKKTLLHGDFSDVQMAIIALRYTIEEGYTYGKQLLAAIFFFIPRDIWTNKGEPTNVLIATNEGFFFKNIASPFYMEGYIDFSIFGLFGYSFFIGYLLAKADVQINFRGDSQGYIVFVVLVAFLPIVIRGSLLAVIGFVATSLLYTLILTTSKSLSLREAAVTTN